MLDSITPVILTYNEEANVGRVLERLGWARRVVVVDSGSTDGTAGIVAGHRNADFLKRVFDSHAAQWNFAVHETSIGTEWVLALDADYLLPPDFVDELRSLRPEEGVGGYTASFSYCVGGRPLKAHLYPPVTVLFRREQGRYYQEGHTQRLRLQGRALPLRARILHDDRKPIESWLRAQVRYMRLEAEHLGAQPMRSLGWADRVRSLRFAAPLAVFFHCLIVKRLLLEGKAGLAYSMQRLCAESILALCLLERDLRRRFPDDPVARP